ncbi:DUF362 domain-containing protein [Candidatus Aminicenantes bacterium AC-708-M15]|jgi:hypothetical protein|nr:DUF362 domain-containing protein [SCandidatus Aminicenantes bacterium Aminicenantia_JdfR_composite]MCP2597150.1 DUF362 domain-containing protein [Candidatus Aminicenantes bacterium AC-335-G13]MCP2604461.1 DUF362 domain-containing protein [Candidatus Aminicenantes bacterium AC-708-M15]
MKSKVYFIQANTKENPESISGKVKKIFLKSGIFNLIEKDSFVALKIHFGEKGNKGHIKPEWLKDIISLIKQKTNNAFFTDTNTLYRGNRADAISHLKIAEEHGFSLEKTGIPVIIADGLFGRDYQEVEINQKHFSKVKIARAIYDADFLLGLTHITGHILTGFGGTIKNIAMGCSSRTGKLEQHCDVKPEIILHKCNACKLCISVCPEEAISIRGGKAYIAMEKCIGCGECLAVCRQGAVKINWDESSHRVQEKMAEYAIGVLEPKQKFGFINFILKTTKDCDCLAKDQPALVEDIGILASNDPIAIDIASVDLINKKADDDLFKKIYPSINWKVQLEYGAKIGLGNLKYELIEIN